MEVADAEGAGTIPGGHGEFPFVFVVEAPFVPGVAVAPAGTLEFWFVVDVAEAGVLPMVLVVPFCCVAGVAVLGVEPGVGVMPGDGVMPWFGVMPCVGVMPFVGDVVVVVVPGVVDCVVVPDVLVDCAAATPSATASTGTVRNSLLNSFLIGAS